MAKAKSNKQMKADSNVDAAHADSPQVLFWIGVMLLVTAIAASLMLALDHFSLTTLPGCGPASGCAQATRGPWGKIPGVDWPVSLVGLAYFGGVLVAWLMGCRKASAGFRTLLCVGAAASIVFVAVMISGGYMCKYCAAVHAANILFVWLAFSVPKAASGAYRRPMAAGAGAFVVLTALLAVANWQTAKIRHDRDEKAFAESTRKIIEKTAENQNTQTNQNNSNTDPNGTATTPNNTNTNTNTTTPPTSPGPNHAVYTPPGGFTGRWRMGPENAPIRIVILSDYQCTDCKAMETQVRAIMATRTDVSVSAKHFPLCADCNSFLTKTIHPNACWAARAAEAAGILKGNDGFWAMHKWLFDRGGSFTDAQLPVGLRELGYQDTQQFINVMMSDATLGRVKADIDEGNALGLYFTPMVFINGVELRGFFNNPTALQRAVEAVAASNPAPGSPLQDKPPLAPGKAVGDWREQFARPLTPKARDWSIGPEDAPIKVWVWGDYQLSYTGELDQHLREAMTKRGDIRYTYRHYPVDQSCNPNVPQTMSSAGCWAARVAEAAGSLGGNDGFWKMHAWLMENPTKFNEAALRQAAPQLGFDADKLVAAIDSPEVRAIVNNDAAMGKPMIMQGVPSVYVNGKWVARWKMDKTSVLDLVFDEAGKK